MRGAIVLTAMALSGAATLPAHAHSWYPRECCSGDDCAPVDRIERLSGPESWLITSRHGKAILRETIPRRESPDGRAHVCMRADEFGAVWVVCYFTPRSM